MIERRSCSTIKPWLYFFMEMSIFISLGIFIVIILGRNIGLPVALLFIAAIVYKSRAFQRLEKVLERTKDVKRVKMQEKYGTQE